MSAKKLLDIVSRPEVNALSNATWIKQAGLFDLLESQRTGANLLLSGFAFNGGSILIQSFLVPLAALTAPDVDDLVHWSGPFNSWSCGLVTGGGLPPRVELATPHDSIGSKTLAQGQNLVFHRYFEGRSEDENYYEVAQFLTHAHGLHWTPERRAWCRLNDEGDVDSIIKLDEIEGNQGYGGSTAIVIERSVLELHMSATSTALVQLFDSTCTPSNFTGWDSRKEEFVRHDADGLFYRVGVSPGHASYVRGVQIIRPAENATECGERLVKEQTVAKQYEVFMILDWKNNKVTDVSCAPEALASYFDKDSRLPFQISPVFFKPQVLDKYKADPKKYKLDQRSITCRNSWHLATYDINEHGQVHTYIKYLGDMPHSEQIYWKAFNEAPRGSISKRAFTTDIVGDFDKEPDPLRDLVRTVQALARSNPGWFSLHDAELVAQLHYPVTESTKLWGDTLKTLAKCVAEGLEKSFFAQVVLDAGGTPDARWGSIRMAEEALRVVGVDDEAVAQIISPLRDLQSLRTKLDAHSGGSEAARIRTQLLRQHKSPRQHVASLCESLRDSLRRLASAFGGLSA